MKYFLILLITSNLFANSSFTNKDFSMEKFSGLWYEIARMPNSYQETCVASSVEYILQDDNSYDVFNRCFENSINGKLIEYEGSAKKIQSKNNISKLKMRYFYVFTSEYNIIYINDYKTAVVSNDDFSSVWIMSRVPSINDDELKMILNNLDKKMNTNDLIFTKLDSKGRYK